MNICQKLKTLIFKIIPEKRLFPVSLVIALQFIVYSGTKLLEADRVHIDLSLPIDNALPFLPVFVLFYVLAFVQWLFYYLLLAREDTEIARRFLTAGIISKTMCFVIFNLLPTTMQRPELNGHGLFTELCRIVYYFDTPTNLFPSMHCVESWFCLRLALKERGLGRVPVIMIGIKNYSSGILSYLSRKEWSAKQSGLQPLEHSSRSGKLLHWRRKWVDNSIAPENGNVEYDMLYIKAHTFFTCMLSLLVVLSTVFIKQHLFVDTLAGIAVTEVGLFAAKYIRIPGFVTK